MVTAKALQRRLEPGSRIDHYTFTDSAMRALAGDNADDAEMDSSYDKYGPYNYSVIQLGHLVGQGRDTGTTVELVWSMQAEESYHRARVKIARLGALLLCADQWLSQQRKLFPALSPALEKVIYAIIAFVVGLIVGRLGG